MPRTKTSMTPGAGEVAAGAEVRPPPRFTEGAVQFVPSGECFHTRVPLVACAKRSRPTPSCELTAGAPKVCTPAGFANAFMQTLIFVSTCVASVHEVPVALK